MVAFHSCKESVVIVNVCKYKIVPGFHVYSVHELFKMTLLVCNLVYIVSKLRMRKVTISFYGRGWDSACAIFLNCSIGWNKSLWLKEFLFPIGWKLINEFDCQQDLFAFSIVFETCSVHSNFELKMTPKTFICGVDVILILLRLWVIIMR